MGSAFAYQCPHCGETSRVDDGIVGQVVDCPSCEHPFKVEAPVGHLVDSNMVDETSSEIHRPDRAEDELRVIHPVMFRTHPFAFLGYAGLIVLGLAGIVSALMGYEIVGRTFQLVVSGGIALVGLVLLGIWWLNVLYTTLTVTSQRTILRKGLIARQTTEVQHDDVRNIQVDQNVYERVVGVGDLAISSSGQDELEILVHEIPHPEQVAELIRDMQ